MFLYRFSIFLSEVLLIFLGGEVLIVRWRRSTKNQLIISLFLPFCSQNVYQRVFFYTRMRAFLDGLVIR